MNKRDEARSPQQWLDLLSKARARFKTAEDDRDYWKQSSHTGYDLLYAKGNKLTEANERIKELERRVTDESQKVDSNAELALLAKGQYLAYKEAFETILGKVMDRE